MSEDYIHWQHIVIAAVTGSTLLDLEKASGDCMGAILWKAGECQINLSQSFQVSKPQQNIVNCDAH